MKLPEIIITNLEKKIVMRTFVAVEVSDNDVIENITKLQSDIDIHAKPVSTKNLHLTLQFLGEVSEDRIDEVRDVLSKIKFPKFDLEFQGIGIFPNPKFPRVIWIGTNNEGSTKLIKLAHNVENVLTPLGFKSDKPFKSHMTIFRIKDKIENISKKLKKFEESNFGTQRVDKLKFKQSTLTPEGPVYSDLGVINLQ